MESELQDQVARADVIVGGRVADVRPPMPQRGLAAEPNQPISEHTAYWTEAVITVDSVLKGEAPPGETVVLFPASFDIAWAGAPKFHVGQEGVFLLHRQETTPELAAATAVGGAPAFTALDPLDVQPPEDLDRLRELTTRSDDG